MSQIIDARDLDYAIEFMLSQTVDYHHLRQLTLHADYPKTPYEKSHHFVLSKVDFQHELNGSGMSRMQKSKSIQMLAEHEKQVYHEFAEITEEVRKKKPEWLTDSSKYDVHVLVPNGPKGMDPCQTLDQRLFGESRFEAIEKHHKKTVDIAKIKQGSEAEGVFRDEADDIPMPRPQVYHTYCQICNV